MAEPRRVVSYVLAGVAMAALLVLGMYFFAAGLVAPLWAVVGLVLFWLALVVVGALWFRRHPLRVVALPILAAVVLVAVISAGDAWLGWTA